MDLGWNPWALSFLLGSLVQLVVAAFTFFARPRRLLNQALAVAFFAGSVIHFGVALTTLSTTSQSSYAATLVAQMGKLVVLPAYLVFLGVALETPLVRPLRNAAVRGVLAIAAVAGPTLALLRPDLFIGEATRHAVFEHGWGTAVLGTAYDRFAALAFFFGLAASIHAYRRATPGTPHHHRAKLFMVAFGMRDLALAGFIVAVSTVVPPNGLVADVLYHLVLAPTVILFVLLVAYGILYWHLFDLQIQLKWTLRRSLLAGLFLAVFLIVSQLVENLVSGNLGVVAGAFAAGLLLFALTPLQRAAERLANAAMPGVDGSTEYLTHRRLEIYKGTLEELAADGVISEKERAALLQLQKKLGIQDETAAALERDVHASRAARRPPPASLDV